MKGEHLSDAVIETMDIDRDPAVDETQPILLTFKKGDLKTPKKTFC